MSFAYQVSEAGPVLLGPVQVNFQPADMAIPAGYMADAGAAFDDARGYGWVSAKSLGEADHAPLDISTRVTGEGTLESSRAAFFPGAPKEAAWEIMLDPGVYRVTVGAGDSALGVNPNVNAGVADIDAEFSDLLGPVAHDAAAPLATGSGLVTVADGRLTLSASDGVATRITHVEIEAVTLNEIWGDKGRDTIHGGAESDLIRGKQGADYLLGEGGADFLRAGRGADQLDGGAGDDILRGGLGSDTFWLREGGGTDTILDFEFWTDQIRIDGSDMDALMVEDWGDGAIIRYHDAMMVLDGVSTDRLTDDHFIFLTDMPDDAPVGGLEPLTLLDASDHFVFHEHERLDPHGVQTEDGRLQTVTFRNDSDRPLTVTEVLFDSPLFRMPDPADAALNTDYGSSETTQFLGRGGGGDGAAPEMEKAFNLGFAPRKVKVEFDLLEIDTWNNENFFVFIDDQRVDLGPFAMFRDEGVQSGQSGPVAWTMESQKAPADYGFATGDDQTHTVTLMVDDPGQWLRLGFGADLDEPVSNESWGVDNLRISTGAGVELFSEDFQKGAHGWVNHATPTPFETPKTLLPGQTVDVAVLFDDQGVWDDQNRLTSGKMTIRTDEAGDFELSLSGVWQFRPEAGMEPDVAMITQAFGWTNTADGHVVTAQELADTREPGLFATSEATVEIEGSARHAIYWEQVDPGRPVAITQIAAFGAQNSSAELEVYTYTDAPDGPTDEALLDSFTYLRNDAQTFLPRDTDGIKPAGLTFDTDDLFTLRSANQWSDHDRNASGKEVRWLEVWDDGERVEDAWIVAVDGHFGNNDYNDDVYLVENAQMVWL